MLALHLSTVKLDQRARINKISVAHPVQRFSQKEIPHYMGITNAKIKRFFEHDHIQYRYFYLPENKKFSALIGHENFKELLQRFICGALDLTQKALTDCLLTAHLNKEEIDFVCCVTSTGFIVPSLSARLIKHLGLRANCQRADIVGMGCSAGLNGLNTVANWCKANPNKNAVLICVEICSAIYTHDHTPRSAVVNSLFGDGAAVALLRNDNNENETDGLINQPKIIDFESHLIPEYSDELRFDWDEKKSSYSFFVGKLTPQAMAAVADQPLLRLLKKNNVEKQQIKHWIVHGGGNAVLKGLQNKLQLSDYDLRHTRSVLQDFGNLSSGSFLFSYKKLIDEQMIQAGDFGLIITMGPGLAIEMALLQW